MSTRVSFLLVDRNLNGLFAVDGIPAFDDADIDTHVFTPEVNPDVCKLPDLKGDVVVILDADAIPTDDIVSVARSLYGEFTDPDRALVRGLELERLPAFVHLDHALNVAGVAEGWQPDEWRDVASTLSKQMSWSRPVIPEAGDPPPYVGTPALG